MNHNPDFIWKKYSGAWQWVISRVETFSRSNPGMAILAAELRDRAGARLIDFVDQLVVEGSAALAARLESWGYHRAGDRWTHPGAILPRVVFCGGPGEPPGLAVKVDSIAQFLMVRGLELPIAGSPYSRFRQCRTAVSQGVGLWVVERRGADAAEPVINPANHLELVFQVLEGWQTRPRIVRGDAEERETMQRLMSLAERQVDVAGVDLAASLFFEAERQYWQSRNRAAAVQANHLEALGLGWANHDHHTYRSSRQNFSQLLRFFQVLGFRARERFFAGEEAGWGAQVMENPAIAVTLFLDVDLSAEELNIDFANDDLPAAGRLGTVGLWCALHGDSLFEAGLHHLAIRSDFDRLSETLKAEHIDMMNPFSNFPHLRQAFTYGEQWPVKEERVRKLLQDKRITAEAADHFIKNGAVGSHLENIRRADGYKGFSQKEVSTIIKETDPLHYHLEE